MRLLGWLLSRYASTVAIARLERRILTEIQLRRVYSEDGKPSPNQRQLGRDLIVAAGVLGGVVWLLTR